MSPAIANDDAAIREVTVLGLTRSGLRVSTARVQFDNLNNRYIMSISLAALSSTATPAMYVAASQNSNACGGCIGLVWRRTWFSWRSTSSSACRLARLRASSVSQARIRQKIR